MQQTIKLGQVRPSVLSNVERTAKNFNAWWNSTSKTFTSLTGTEGDTFTHGNVVLAHLWSVLALIIIGIGGSLC
jgi:hypothetical protein